MSNLMRRVPVATRNSTASGLDNANHRSHPSWFATLRHSGANTHTPVLQWDGSSDTAPSLPAKSEPKHTQNELQKHTSMAAWRSKSLRKTSFLAFLFILLASIATLAGLYARSRSNVGLLTANTRLHYLWTYAPTLFFTVVAACWSRTAYRTYQMQPWRMISKSQAHMLEALLVDYVTPISVISLLKALRSRHVLVATVILTSMAVEIVTILSTGLFDAEYLQVQRNSTLSRLDSITGQDHDFAAISGIPDLTIYSVQNTNNSYPEGSNAMYAVPKLSSSAVTGGEHLDYNLVSDNYILNDTWGNTDAVTCSSGDARVLISVGLIGYNIVWNGTKQDLIDNKTVVLPSDPNDMFKILTSTNLLCVPQYGTRRAQAIYTTNTTTGSRQVEVIPVSNSTGLKPIEGIGAYDLSRAIMESMSAANSVLQAIYLNINAEVQIVNGPAESEGGYFPTNTDAFFKTMTQQYRAVPGTSKSVWFDSQYLQTASSQFYGAVSAQFASQYLRKDLADNVPGTITTVGPRLVVVPGVFRAIEGLLSFAVLAIIGIMWPLSRAVTPIDPASIGGTTAMLCLTRLLMTSPQPRTLDSCQATVHNLFPESCKDGEPLQLYLPSIRQGAIEGSVPPRPCAWTISPANACANWAGIFGYATDYAFVNYSVVVCDVSYEQIYSNTTFKLPEYAIDKNNPPSVDESEVTTLQSGDLGTYATSLSYMAFYNTSDTTLNGLKTLDSFTTNLIYGSDGVPLKQLFQSHPQDYLIPRIKQVAAIAGAQYISYFYRSTNSSLSSLVNSKAPATLQMPPTYRLKQNAVSTRILDALLATSAIFAAITIYALRYRDVAKAQLGSLAATLALVADSEFVRDLQTSVPNHGTDSSEMAMAAKSNADIVYVEQKLASEGGQFSLGW